MTLHLPTLSLLPAWRRASWCCAAVLALASGAALADDHRARMPAAPPAYQQECAACHVAYPPGLLPAASWQRLMDGLPRHFGTDASVDAATRATLSAWLAAHAGTGRRLRESPPEDRITRSAWFEREHRRVAPDVWRHPGVKQASNCAACHSGAEQGVYDEHQLRLPPGLDARHLRAWRD